MRFATDRVDVMGHESRPVIDMRGERRTPTATAAGAFSGKAYAVNGAPTTGLASDASKPWVKYVRNTMVFSEQTGPPSNPWPANEIWYEKANTYGNIVVTA